MLSAGVIIPVRNAMSLLVDCLETVIPQAQAVGAEVIVVDDGSTDGSAQLAAARGARVIRRAKSGGPYRARNDGWQSSKAPLLLFTDARCRARPGWLARMIEALEVGDVGVAGGEVLVRDGPSLAQRYAHVRQHLRAEASMSGQFMPYFPTCNLGVRRSTLEALGGFRPLVSGGDVDLCWRAQLGGHGEGRFVRGAEVEWEPRATLRELVGQWWKYGRHNPPLFAAFAADGCTVPEPPSTISQLAREVRAFGRRLVRHEARQWELDFIDFTCGLVYWQAYRRSYPAAVRQAASVVAARSEHASR